MAANPALIVRVAATIEELKKNLAEGVSQIETTTAAMGKLAASFSGDKLIQAAHNVTAAVNEIGGASKLTEAEQARVNATLEKALEKYRVLGKEAPAGMQALADATKKVEVGMAAVAGGPATGFFADLSSQIVKVAAGFVSAQAVIGVVTGAYHQLSAFVLDSVKAFAEAESANVRLVAALRQHSLATPEVIAQYTALGATFQRTTIYSDDQIEAMAALLTQIGSVMPSAMQGALKASTDLAAGLGIDLESATRLVAKAAAGHTETLGKYGITVSAAALESKGFDAVLEAINRQFGGQAAAAIETYAGKVAQISNSWNNVQEVVGKFAVQNAFAEATLRKFNTATMDLDQASAGAALSVSGLAKALNLPGASVVLAALEGYVASLNTAADLIDRINKLPKPFDQYAKDNILPPITAGMKLFNDQVAAHAIALKEAEAAEKAWGEQLKAVSSIEREAHALSMDWVKELNEAKAKANLDQMHDTVKSIDDTMALEREAATLRMSLYATDTEMKIQGAHQWFDDEVAKLKASDENYKAHYNALLDVESLKIAAIENAAAATEAGAAREVAAIKTVTGSYWEQIDAAARAAGVVVIGSRPGEVAVSTPSSTFSLGPGLNLGGRASGGPVSRGSSYVVGERGPELFTPSGSGFISPNGNGGGQTIQIYITHPLGSPAAIAAAVDDALMQRQRNTGERMPSGA